MSQKDQKSSKKPSRAISGIISGSSKKKKQDSVSVSPEKKSIAKNNAVEDLKSAKNQDDKKIEKNIRFQDQSDRIMELEAEILATKLAQK